MSGRWDYREHKGELEVSNAGTIYHGEHGVLCWSEIKFDFILHHPIGFKDKAAAYKWIREGCIAEIQESLLCLAVGFQTKLIEERQRP